MPQMLGQIYVNWWKVFSSERKVTKSCIQNKNILLKDLQGTIYHKMHESSKWRGGLVYLIQNRSASKLLLTCTETLTTGAKL